MATLSRLVLAQAPLEVSGDAGVERTIAALEYIDEVHTLLLYMTRPPDKGRPSSEHHQSLNKSLYLNSSTKQASAPSTSAIAFEIDHVQTLSLVERIDTLLIRAQFITFLLVT